MAAGEAEEEEVVQQCHRWHHAQVRLEIVGGYRQEKNGVGMEMESLQPVMLEDRIEEVGEGGTRPAMTLLMEKG